MDEDQPVPERFRGLVEVAVGLIRDGDREALASHDRISFVGDDPLLWLREDAVELTPLPTEAWASSIAGPMEGEPGAWWLVVDLWDSEGRTDYSLEGSAFEQADGIRLVVNNIHMM